MGLAVALFIFCLRIVDVSIGTVRVIYTVRGHRTVAALLGVIESAIWMFAISRVFHYVNNPLSIAGWALGFGTGTAVGITLERWIASGSILVRVISIEQMQALRESLMNHGFGVTALAGEGRSGNLVMLFVVGPRRRGEELLKLIQQIDPEAFITIDPITRAIGGYMPMHVPAASLRK